LKIDGKDKEKRNGEIGGAGQERPFTALKITKFDEITQNGSH